jgi:hypothetical protein
MSCSCEGGEDCLCGLDSAYMNCLRSLGSDFRVPRKTEAVLFAVVEESTEWFQRTNESFSVYKQ